MPTVTMVDKAVAAAKNAQETRTVLMFRQHFGKNLVVRPVGLTASSVEYVLPDGQEFTGAERAWINVFTEGYGDALGTMLVHQRVAQNRRY